MGVFPRGQPAASVGSVVDIVEPSAPECVDLKRCLIGNLNMLQLLSLFTLVQLETHLELQTKPSQTVTERITAIVWT